MRLIVAVALVAVLIGACGTDADAPHRQAVDAFKRWEDSFETAEYYTTALGVGERPTGEFQFQGEVKYRKDPESLWTILYLDDEAEDSQDSEGDFQQLRVDNEEYISVASVWNHAGSVDDEESIALENELRSMLGTPIFTDRQVLEQWLKCADEAFGSISVEDWLGQPAWIIRCRAAVDLVEPEDREAASDLVKSVMSTLFGQAPGAADQLEELIDTAEVGYFLALQTVIHRQSGALLMVDLAITLTDEGARSDIRWQTELVSYDQPIDFPDVTGVTRN